MYVFYVAGIEDKEDCRMEQLYIGIKAGIKGLIHLVQLLCKQHL